MEETHFFITELMNCISWVILTGAIIWGMVRIIIAHEEVKHAIKKKIEAETEKIKNDCRSIH